MNPVSPQSSFGYEQYLLQFPAPAPSSSITVFPFNRQQRRYAPIGTPSTPFVISRMPYVTREQGGYATGSASRMDPKPSASKRSWGASHKSEAKEEGTGKLFGADTPDFFSGCVKAAPFIPSVASEEEHQVAGYNWSPLEWKARAEYWREQAESLVYKSEHFQTKSAELGVQLGTCTQLLQLQTEQTTKDTQALLDCIQGLKAESQKTAEMLGTVQGENGRLAALLSTYIRKAQAHDDMKGRLDRLVEENASLEEVMVSMSCALSGFLKKSSEEAAVDQFCGSFFASHPCDNEGVLSQPVGTPP